MSSLFVLRTPFQGWLADVVRRVEVVENFDLIYLTLEDSEEDRTAYRLLAKKSTRQWYVVLRPSRPDFLLEVKIAWRLRVLFHRFGKNWTRVYLASYDCHGINALAQRIDTVVTFDDGTANIFLGGAFDVNGISGRTAFYRRLLGGIGNREFIEKISTHFTVFSERLHLVPAPKLKLLDNPAGDYDHPVGQPIVYFIGAPFEQVLTNSEIDRISRAVKKLKVDFYVPHPREKSSFLFGSDIPILAKRGVIAEQAIDRHAGERPVWVFGWFSTVMFTMRARASRRVMFLVEEDVHTSRRSELARSVGCEVCLV